jgi:hypothetical protein
MKFLRNLPGFKLIDERRNTDIRVELNIYYVGYKIEHRKLDLVEYNLRTKESQLQHAVLQCKPTGRQNLSRLKTRWILDDFSRRRARPKGLEDYGDKLN